MEKIKTTSLMSLLLVAHLCLPLLSQTQPSTLSRQNSAETRVPPDVADQHLKQKEEPEYPTKALDAQLQGDVVLDVLIGKNGKVKEVHLVSGDPILSRSAVDAVRHWRYAPFISQGAGVETRTTVTVHFVLTTGPYDCPGQQANQYNFRTDLSTPSSSSTTAQTSPQQAVFKVGGSVKPPQAVHTPDPQYTPSARKAARQGTAVLSAIVTPEGRIAVVKMERVLGYGLDQKAIDAVCQWKFKPALKDDRPVAVQINVEVTFRLY